MSERLAREYCGGNGCPDDDDDDVEEDDDAEEEASDTVPELDATQEEAEAAGRDYFQG